LIIKQQAYQDAAINILSKY